LRLRLKLEHNSTTERYNIGRFRISLTGAPKDVVGLPIPVRLAMEVPVEQRRPEHKRLLKEEFNKVDRERIPIAGRVTELKQLLQQLKSAITTTLVMRERAEPRETYEHVRGDFLRPGAAVEPGVPDVLPKIRSSSGRPNRLDFARWLVDPENPLTARVTVNRLWQQYFGQGLVLTENDFGKQGSPPTHAELLDWLATEFVTRCWSLKAMHRLIVTSATYRQSSHARADLAESDPDNKLLGRQARLRLEAEAIRDVALAASGLLWPELGGPGSYPPQPAGVYRFTQVVKYWTESQGPDRYRRGLYTYFWRSSPYPFLSTFDAPDANVTCTRRVRSNTPLQALTLANDRAFVELAQGLAARILHEAGSQDSERLNYAFRLCLARPPESSELAALDRFLQDQRRRFSLAPDQAEAVASKDVPSPAIEAAAWTQLARVLINLDEFMTRE
jgi:hypothetical protein